MKKKTNTWLETAIDDLTLAKELSHKKGRAHYAAYFCHQAIEKLLKALISEYTDEVPLPTHNFKILLKQAKLEDIPEDEKKFIYGLAPHYIGTKYPEDINKLYKQYTNVFAQKLHKETKKVFEWLKAYLK
jgi:HEPN domain-containing protein